MSPTIDVKEAATILATQMIRAGRIETFEPDGAVDPVQNRVDHAIHRKVQAFLESELRTLLGQKAA